MRASEWAFDRVKEAFNLVAKDQVEKMSIVQEIMLKSKDCLRRIIAPVVGTRRCHNVVPVPELDDYVWWVTAGKKHKVVVRNLWRRGTTGGNRAGCSSCKQGKALSRRRSSKRMRYRRAFAEI